jgi:hypothetical protein
MKVHAGVDKDSGLIHSVVTTAAELLYGDEEVVYGDAGFQGIAKRPEMAGKSTEFRVAMRPGKRRALPNTPDGRLQDLTETANDFVAGQPWPWPGRRPPSRSCCSKTRPSPLLPLDPARSLAVIGSLVAIANLGDRGSSDTRPEPGVVVTPLQALHPQAGQVEGGGNGEVDQHPRRR